MPAAPRPVDPVWKQAWDTALYGTSGFLRTHPMECSTSAASVLAVVSSVGPARGDVALLGCAGTLATQLSDTGRTVRFDVPEGYDGLVVALDWLAHVPTHVVEMGADGHPHVVHVSPLTGRESLGSRLNDTSVPQSIGLWLEEWWPLVDFGTGARAEVGTSRDAAWLGVVTRLGPGGRAIAIDRGHVRDDRPLRGSLASPSGRSIPDGSRDLTAAVALDAVAAATGSRVVHGADLSHLEFTAPVH